LTIHISSAPENGAPPSESTLSRGYLHRLYGPANGEGYLAVWNKATKATEWFPVTPEGLSLAEAQMLTLSQTTDVYFSWCLQAAPAASGRGAANTAVFCPGIMFDADLKSSVPGVHAQAALPSTLEDVLDWLATAKLPEPTHIRSSGNGLYLDYLLDGPMLMRTPEERANAAALVAGFHRRLIASAHELRGWRFDFTGDLARVTRMPGTFNHKTNPAKPVEVVR
jgi:hypothetical protein